MTLPHNIVKASHEVFLPALTAGAQVVDATCGNGHDTVYCAKQVGPSGHVFALDIQPAAIQATTRRVQDAGFADRVSVIESDHVTWLRHHGQTVAAVIFNLGYLPGGDQATTTTAANTINALNAARDLLAPRGRLAVVAYPGHSEGAKEAAAVEQWFQQLDPGIFDVFTHQGQRGAAPPPHLFWAIRGDRKSVVGGRRSEI